MRDASRRGEGVHQNKIIEQAIIWLVSSFVPGAGLVKAVIGIYDTVVFAIRRPSRSPR